MQADWPTVKMSDGFWRGLLIGRDRPTKVRHDSESDPLYKTRLHRHFQIYKTWVSPLIYFKIFFWVKYGEINSLIVGTFKIRSGDLKHIKLINRLSNPKHIKFINRYNRLNFFDTMSASDDVLGIFVFRSSKIEHVRLKL